MRPPRNFLLLSEAAGIPRSRTIIWNIVPWYIGAGSRIRPATSQDIRAGCPYLERLLGLLPRLALAVLVGRKAQRIRGQHTRLRPELQVFHCPHPSPLFINRRPENRVVLLEALRAVAAQNTSRSQPG